MRRGLAALQICISLNSELFLPPDDLQGKPGCETGPLCPCVGGRAHLLKACLLLGDKTEW